jgi:hypothetical protein
MHIHTSHSPSTATTSIAPTLAAAIVAIDGWTDLSPPRRTSLRVSLESVADMLGDPPALIVLTPRFLRTRLLLLPPSTFGISEGTMKNHRSALRRVLERLGTIDACDALHSAAWGALLEPLDSRQKAPLAKLADFCALRRIEPDQLPTRQLPTCARRPAPTSAAWTSTPRPSRADHLAFSWKETSPRCSGSQASAPPGRATSMALPFWTK